MEIIEDQKWYSKHRSYSTGKLILWNNVLDETKELIGRKNTFFKISVFINNQTILELVVNLFELNISRSGSWQA